MALVLYSNGIIEEFKPANLTFTDIELTQSFDKNFAFLVSSRLPDVLNTWCIWGEMKDPPEFEYNKIASEIVNTDVLSHIIFIHDSEINPDWKMADSVLYKDYKSFMIELGDFIDDIVRDLSESMLPNASDMAVDEDSQDAKQKNMVFLTSRGITEDKRVLFSFDPAEQSDGFYKDEVFSEFADRIYEYLGNNFYDNPQEPNHPLVIFADTKTIISVYSTETDSFFIKLLDYYTKTEQYEVCEALTGIKKAWDDYTYLQKAVLETRPQHEENDCTSREDENSDNNNG